MFASCKARNKPLPGSGANSMVIVFTHMCGQIPIILGIKICLVGNVLSVAIVCVLYYYIATLM